MQLQILNSLYHWGSRWRGLVTLRRKEVQAPLLVMKARLPLGPHHQLFLVESGGRELMIATAPQGVQLLVMRPRKESGE